MKGVNKKAIFLAVIFLDKWGVFPFHCSIDPPDGEGKMNAHHRTQINSANYRYGQILPGGLLSLAMLSHTTWTGKTSLLIPGKPGVPELYLCITDVQIQSQRFLSSSFTLIY